MRESMTLIEQGNNFKRTNHHRSYFEPTLKDTQLYYSSFSKKDELKKNLSFNVYSSRHLLSTARSSRRQQSDEHFLPLIDKDRRKTKRPSYRTSLYHPRTSNCVQLDLSKLTARGTNPVLLTTIRDDDTIINIQRNHAPPPSPSDDQIERLSLELSRTGRSSPRSSIEQDGYVPYRLPALNQSTRRSHTDLHYLSKDTKSSLSNYLQTFY